MTTIALSMIVRDEEAMLADCLSSVRGAVDDVVVVDTGSRDATKRIATEAGARIFDFTWCDDFAAARNEGLRRVRADWVLVLDADERLAPGSGERIRAAVRRATFDCGMLRLHDAVRPDAPLGDVISGRERQAEVQLVPRLLRRVDGLRYVDRIHENVAPWLRRRGMKVAGVDADIVHFGATQQVVDAKSKIERNVRMLRARIEKSPADLSAYGYLVHDLIRSGAVEEARETAERGWAQLDSGKPTPVEPIHRLATARAYLFVGNGQFEAARETVARAQAIEGQNPDFTFLAAYASESEAMRSGEPLRGELLAAARDGYRACLGFEGRVFAQSFVFGASSWCGATRLGTVELLRGDPAEALRAFDLALASKPDDRAARLGRAEAMIALGDSPGALRRIEGLLDNSSPDAWTLAALAVHALGLAGDTRLFAQRACSIAGKGFVSAHRREHLRRVVAAINGSSPALSG